jgi:hypothetical protein
VLSTFITTLNLTKSAPWNPLKTLKGTPCLPIPELDRAPPISPFTYGCFSWAVMKILSRPEDRPQTAEKVRTTKEV